ncbi:dehydrogenase/reductase SDR family member FEY-like [Nicotiana tabacum]|uniref:Dehydrogenase/reductase SDR family member FEY-like n=2 Tax=Nicotiana TaxID=4085 RepID=A0A1S3YCG2_TOBAC|nr:PREDICTED: retinol dehydrogenase 12-like [Nicotiana sylvestris]XP_016449687.1 PREDICTED: retinol dehydrogenase 12-like [Nicotiana tabacum]
MGPSSAAFTLMRKEKTGLGWIEWIQGWYRLTYETLFQKINARNLHDPLPLPPLNGQTCIVTGATSGIGLEIARQLANSGAHLVMAVRNTNLAHQIIQKWQRNEPDSSPLSIDVLELDLLSLKSVVKFAQEWNSRSKPLHGLINNAGIYSIGQPQKISKDGYETHLQVNHLGPALLSVLLLPSLKRGAPSRIVNVNSLLHTVGFVDSQDMNFITKKNKFLSRKAYSNSKLAQIMFSSMFQKYIPTDAGIYTLCVEPGAVRTNVTRDLPRILNILYQKMFFFMFDAQQGSRSALFAATDVDILKYCDKLKAEEWPVCAFIGCHCKPTNPSKEAHNVETCYQVWEKTLEMVGLSTDVVDMIFQGKEIHCRYGTDKDQ